MTESSIIIRAFETLWRQFLLFYSHSLLKRVMDGCIRFMMRIWDGSFVKRLLFIDSGMGESFQRGLSGRMLGAVGTFGLRLSSVFRNAVDNSLIIAYPRRLCGDALTMSVRGYGILCMAFGLSALGLRLALGGLRDMIFLMAIGLLILGAGLWLLNRSLAALYNGSFLAKVFGGFFGLERLDEGQAQTQGKRYYPIAFLLMGILFGTVGATQGLTSLVMVAGGLVGGCLVLYRAEIGVFAAAFLLPILPTMFGMGLALISVISFILKVFITGQLRLRFHAIDLFAALFALLIAYSTCISYFPGSSLFMAGSYILFILFYFVVRHTVDTREKLFALLSLVAVSGALVALYGIYQRLTGSYISAEAWIDSDMFEGASARIYATLENPNVLGEYLLFVIPIIFAMLYYMKNYFHKLVALGMLGLSVLCMVFTLSRGAWLGLLCGLVVFVLLRDRRLIWVGLIALLAMPFVLPQSIIERFLSIGNMSDGSTSYRVNIWMASFGMLMAFWPIGIGLGTDTFIFIYRKYAFNAVNAPHSHNLFLQVGIDLGIWGLLLLVFVLCLFYKDILKGIRKCKGSSFMTAAGAALCAGMAGFLVQSLTDNTWFNYRVVMFFWMIVALSAAFIGQRPSVGLGGNRDENS